MTPAKLAELRALAEKATQGPWSARPDIGGLESATALIIWPQNSIPRSGVSRMLGSCGTDAEGKGEANLAFIAAANPQTVLALLDEIERLQHVIGTPRCAEELLAKLRLEQAATADLEQQLAAAREECERLRVDANVEREYSNRLRALLAAMTAAHNEACDKLETWIFGLPEEKRSIGRADLNRLRSVGTTSKEPGK
jgi:Ead/Ea22-like protein